MDTWCPVWSLMPRCDRVGLEDKCTRNCGIWGVMSQNYRFRSVDVHPRNSCLITSLTILPPELGNLSIMIFTIYSPLYEVNAHRLNSWVYLSMIGRNRHSKTLFLPWKRCPAQRAIANWNWVWTKTSTSTGQESTSIYEIAINLGYILFFHRSVFFQRNQHVSNMTFFCTGAWPNQLSWCRALPRVAMRRVDLGIVGWRVTWNQNPYWLILGREFHHEKLGIFGGCNW